MQTVFDVSFVIIISSRILINMILMETKNNVRKIQINLLLFFFEEKKKKIILKFSGVK